jgi:hypothetical protein
MLDQGSLAGTRLRGNRHDAAMTSTRHSEGLVQLLQLFVAL